MGQTRSLSSWAFLAVVGLCASAASSLVYWQLIVPQLPGLRSVPPAWWAVMLLPQALFIVWAAYRCASLADVLASAGAMVLPWVLVQAAYAAMTGRPVGHDLWISDPQYWLLVVFSVATSAGAVAAIAFMFRRWRLVVDVRAGR